MRQDAPSPRQKPEAIVLEAPTCPECLGTDFENGGTRAPLVGSGEVKRQYLTCLDCGKKILVKWVTFRQAETRRGANCENYDQ